MYKIKTTTERFRIWVPKKIRKALQNDFIEVIITNGLEKGFFVTTINNDGRIVIPKDMRISLKIKKRDSLDIGIKKIVNRKRESAYMKDYGFDILGFIPRKTMSNFPILVRERNRKLYLWYSAKGRPRDVVIKRHVPKHFARMLGLYQAEGAKIKFVKRRGRTLSFVNKEMNLIKDFIRLSSFLFPPHIWNARIRYNSKLAERKINFIKKELIDIGIKKSAIRLRTAQRISNFTITLWISSSVLAETIFNMVNIVREDIALKNKIICKYFLQGLIAGDGCFSSYRDKKGSLHSRISLFDLRLNYIKGYEKLLKLFGIYGKIRKDRKRNMFAFEASSGWETLLQLQYSNLLVYKQHQQKLMQSILGHKRFRSLRYLCSLPDSFSRSISLGGKGTAYRNTWLQDRTNEGLLRKSKEGDFWSFSDRGLFVRNVLNTVDTSLKPL